MATRQSRPVANDHRLSDEVDPGRTARVRRRAIKTFNRRWQAVRGDLRETIERNDALRLSRSSGSDAGSLSTPKPRTAVARSTLRPDDFGVATTAQRLNALSEWFRYVLDRRIVVPIGSLRREAGDHYTAEAVLQGYLRGHRAAGIELRHAGYDAPRVDPSEVIQQNQHEAPLARVYSQTYHDVSVVAEAVETDVVRTAAELLGGSPRIRTLASRLAKRVDSVGQTRTEMVATSSVIDALNTAALTRYRRAGVRDVRIIGGVSDRDAEEGSYSVDAVLENEAPRPPLHPRCTRFVVPA